VGYKKIIEYQNFYYFCDPFKLLVVQAQPRCLQTSNIEDANNAISVSSEEGVSISVPAQGSADGVLGLAVEVLNGVLVEVSNNALALKIPDLDRGVGTSAEPVSVGAESKSVDDGSSLEGVQVLALV